MCDAVVAVVWSAVIGGSVGVVSNFGGGNFQNSRRLRAMKFSAEMDEIVGSSFSSASDVTPDSLTKRKSPDFFQRLIRTYKNK